MKHFKLKTAALLAATALSAVMVSPANAYVMAGSMVKMTNFVIQGSNGNTLDYVNDFSFLTFTSSADQSVGLTGFADISNAGNMAPIDFAPICLGAGCNPILPNNSFPKLTAPPTPLNYAAADQEEGGAPISSLPGGFPTGATVANGSYVGIDTGSAVGSGNSNNNLNSSFVFSLNQDQGITFDFDVDAFLQSALTSDENFPSFATASYQMDFTITNLTAGGTTVWTYSPDLFGDGTKTISLNAPLPIDVEAIRDTGGAVNFTSTTAALTAGTLYQLSARIQTNADAGREVPAPAVLALMAIGLLGIGAVRRLA